VKVTVHNKMTAGSIALIISAILNYTAVTVQDTSNSECISFMHQTFISYLPRCQCQSNAHL